MNSENRAEKDVLEQNFRAIDLKMAEQIQAYEKQNNPKADTATLYKTVLKLSQALGRGQVCVHLHADVQSVLEGYAVVHAQDDALYANQPLVLAHNKLYIARYYFYEKNVLEEIQQRANKTLNVDTEKLADLMQRLFPENSAAEIDWQKVAAASACLQSFSIITGGPGTGKTTTVTKLLSALLALTPDLNIALAAPTGKAAARMTESIRNAKLKLTNLYHSEKIPEKSFTLHRLLGASAQGFRYNQNLHLPYDCVVVDEASMIDLPMMSHLLCALSQHARLILLGDRDQLASVEVGSVLADLCDAGVEHGPSPEFARVLTQVTGFDFSAVVEPKAALLQNNLAQLRVSYRFHKDSGIGHLARAVNTGNKANAHAALTQSTDGKVAWLLLDEPNLKWPKYSPWRDLLLTGFKPYTDAVQNYLKADASKNPEALFQALNQFQLLVAIRKGAFGVEMVNAFITQLLHNEMLLPRAQDLSQWFAGRVVMISENNYDLNIFNGDVGIALPHEGKLRVAFLQAEGGVRWLLPSRLPAHETAFAMTVHKSQGSEFTHVALLLPNEHQNVISRELIYTAITRAKTQFTLVASALCWEQGLALQVERASGLRDILWPKAGVGE